MVRLTQSLRPFYNHLCSRIAASAERHETEVARHRRHIEPRNIKPSRLPVAIRNGALGLLHTAWVAMPGSSIFPWRRRVVS